MSSLASSRIKMRTEPLVALLWNHCRLAVHTDTRPSHCHNSPTGNWTSIQFLQQALHRLLGGI